MKMKVERNKQAKKINTWKKIGSIAVVAATAVHAPLTLAVAGGVKAMQGLSKTFRKPESQIEFMYPNALGKRSPYMTMMDIPTATVSGMRTKNDNIFAVTTGENGKIYLVTNPYTVYTGASVHKIVGNYDRCNSED